MCSRCPRSQKTVSLVSARASRHYVGPRGRRCLGRGCRSPREVAAAPVAPVLILILLVQFAPAWLSARKQPRRHHGRQHCAVLVDATLSARYPPHRWQRPGRKPLTKMSTARRSNRTVCTALAATARDAMLSTQSGGGESHAEEPLHRCQQRSPAHRADIVADLPLPQEIDQGIFGPTRNLSAMHVR
jgi:hypothetical protein